MIIEKKIDAEIFKKMFINGAINLKSNYEKINTLNVFPIPDGDTGNNMKITMMKGVEKINKIQYNSIIEVAEVLSTTLLKSAQGNSGVILSQFFSGIYLKLKEMQKNTINTKEFIEVFKNGAQKAYQAVSTPTEGTMLTVIRESIENINITEETTIKQLIKKIVQKSEISLQKTPNLLPILKKAKVVDSGGAGFVEILKGMSLFDQDIKSKIKDTNIVHHEITTNNYEAITNLNPEEIKYIYCSEFIIIIDNIKKINLENIKQMLNNKGDSLITIIDENILKIHIHTNKPGNILNFLLKYGNLDKIKIENMKKQYEKIVKNKQNNKTNLQT